MAFAMMENQAVDTANAGPTLLAPPVKSAFLGNMELIVPMVSAQIELLFWFNGFKVTAALHTVTFRPDVLWNRLVTTKIETCFKTLLHCIIILQMNKNYLKRFFRPTPSL